MVAEGNDPVYEALKKQMENLSQQLYEVRQDIYSNEQRRRKGALERIEQMETRQGEQHEILEAFQRREAEREKRDARRAKVINSFLALITTILAGFAVAGLNSFFLGA